jgi:hypothetical protein
MPAVWPIRPGPNEIGANQAADGCISAFSAPFAENMPVIRRTGNNNLRTYCGHCGA